MSINLLLIFLVQTKKATWINAQEIDAWKVESSRRYDFLHWTRYQSSFLSFCFKSIFFFFLKLKPVKKLLISLPSH